MEFNRFFGYLIRRGRTEAALLAAASVSILLAAAVVSGSPIYLRSLELLGIDQTLDDLGIGGQHVQINTNFLTLDQGSLESATADIERLARQNFGDFYVTQERVSKSAPHLWGSVERGLNTRTGASRAFFQAHTNIQDHIGYISGRHPSGGITAGPDGPVIEASVYEPRARRLGVSVEDIIVVRPDGLISETLTVRITGTFAEISPLDQFWLGLSEPLLSPPSFTAGNDLPLTLFVPTETLVGPVGRNLEGIPSDATWFLFMDGEALRLEDAETVISMIAEFEGDVAVELPRPLVTTGLAVALEDYRIRALFTRVPMLLMAALALAAAVYGLFMVTGIIADRRRGELAMLRSRGVSSLQITRMYLIEGAVFIGLPVALAPLLAAYVVAQVGRFGPYRDITGGGTLPVELSAYHFGLAALTGIAALLLTTGPALLRLRASLADENRVAARPDRKPFFQRFFLDVGIMVLGIVVWFELRERGALISSGLADDQSTDLTLLFAPALFLVAGILGVLRVFPYAASAASWLAGRVAPAWFALGFWRIARSPFHSAWTVLLIALVVGAAIITGTLASTLQRSQEERILYETATDLRVIAPEGGSQAGRQLAERLRAVPGVTEATSVLRRSARTGTTGAGIEFEFFAVEPEVFGKISWFRDDFSSRSLPELMESITVVPRAPLVVPDDATSIGIWLKPENPVFRGFVWVALRGPGGLASVLSLGSIDGDEWQFRSAELEQVGLPAQVIGIHIFQNIGGDRAIPNTIFFDDLEVQTVDRLGRESITILEDFESERTWSGLATSEGLDTRFTLVPELLESGLSRIGSVSGTQVARLAVGRGTDSGVRGMAAVGDGPIPAIASKSFLAASGLAVGATMVATLGEVKVPLRIVDTVNFMPTLDPGEGGFIVADLVAVRDFVDQKGAFALSELEALIQLSPFSNRSALPEIRLLLRNAKFLDRRELEQEAFVDPLVAAGWRGIAALAAAITIIAGFIGYSAAQAAHARRTSDESAFILTLGLTRGQFLRMLMVEHLAIGGLGIALGVVSGLTLSRIVVDSVAHTERGTALLPPFQLATSWLAFGLVVAALAATFVAVLALRARKNAGPAHGAIARIGIREVR
ncbi:MAG: FtsX-like permease family protein [Chloroflexi bacterium]|nr:FtsX-like permease family protein [Chloroflexota bacterium]